MICTHGYDGQAIAMYEDGHGVWVRADMRVTISDEMSHSREVLAVYEINDWCPNVGAWHATRRFA